MALQQQGAFNPAGKETGGGKGPWAKRFAAALVCIACLITIPVFAAAGAALPPGTPLSVMLQEVVTTESAYPGQMINTMITQDIYIGTKKILSRGDRVLGTVSRVEPPIEGRNAILQIDFNHLVRQNGIEADFISRVDTGEGKPAWGGEVTPGTKPVVIPYNIYRVGTYGRVMFHGPREMGQHVKLMPGTRIVVIIQEPPLVEK